MAYWDNFSWVSSTSPITNLLEKEDTTLENVLDEDEILSELRNSNEALIEYLSKPETLSRVIDYIIKPHPDLPDDLKYRYPYLCSEVFCYDSANLYEEILADDLLDKLFSFLYEEAPLELLQSSYFNRVVTYIINKKIDYLLEYLEKKDGFLERVLNHIYSSAISDIVMKLLNCPKDEKVDRWFAEEKFASKLILKLSPEECEQTHENAAEILQNICSMSFQKINGGNDPPALFQQLNQEQNISKIIELIFQQPSSSSLRFGGEVITELASGEKSDIYDTNAKLDTVPVVFRVLAQSLPQIQNALSNAPDDIVQTSFGQLSPPFGFCRMQAMRIFESIIASRFICMYEEVLKNTLFQTCVDLFFKYQWNNFVHTVVARSCETILGCNEDEIVQQFITQTKIHEKIGEAGETPNVNGEGSSRKGFMGHLALMATAITSASEVNSQLEDILETSTSWKKYLQGDFATIKNVEATPLGNAEGGDGENREIDQLISTFHEITKRGFEDDFPDTFTPCNETNYDITIQPTDNKIFMGINTDEDEMDEFNSDEEDFMASDEDE